MIRFCVTLYSHTPFIHYAFTLTLMPFIRPSAFRPPTIQRNLSSLSNVTSPLTARIRISRSAFQSVQSLSFTQAACRQPHLVLTPTRASALLPNQSTTRFWTQNNARHFASTAATTTTVVDTTERVQKLRDLMRDPKYNVTAL